jgi:hypothetical protein
VGEWGRGLDGRRDGGSGGCVRIGIPYIGDKCSRVERVTERGRGRGRRVGERDTARMVRRRLYHIMVTEHIKAFQICCDIFCFHVKRFGSMQVRPST